MVLRSIPKMSPDFLIALLDALDFEGITHIWISMNEQGVEHKDYPDGRRVWTNKQVDHIWRGENIKRIRDFTEWAYVKDARIEWGENTKCLYIDDCLTTVGLRGFFSLPFDLKSLPGQGPQKIILHL